MSQMDILNIMKQRKQDAQAARDASFAARIHRHQRRTSSPAIAELQVSFPESIDPAEFVTYFERLKEGFPIETPMHTISVIDARTFTITVQGALSMYKWCEFFISSFINDWGPMRKGYGVEVDGTWEKYDTDEYHIPSRRQHKQAY